MIELILAVIGGCVVLAVVIIKCVDGLAWLSDRFPEGWL